MKLEGTYAFDAPSSVVWDAIMTPEVLASVIPGCKQLKQVGDNEYAADLIIKVGPVQGDFQGAVKLSNINAPQSYRLHVEGRGQAGYLKGIGDVRLEDQHGSTLMHYGGEAQVGGRMASIGQRLMDSTAKAMTKQSLDGLHRQVKARHLGTAAIGTTVETGRPPAFAPTPIPDVAAPSQTEFAIGVAKNMLEDFVPPERRPLVVGGGLLLLFVLLNWWLKALVRQAVREALRKELG